MIKEEAVFDISSKAVSAPHACDASSAGNTSDSISYHILSMSRRTRDQKGRARRTRPVQTSPFIFTTGTPKKVARVTLR